MSGWVRFENTMPEDAKLPGISDRAFRLWVNAVCYCSRGETDGRIPAALMTSLSITANKRTVDELVDAGMLKAFDDKYEIVNYLKFNPSKERISQLKRAGRERVAKHRKRSGVTRDSAQASSAVSLTRATDPGSSEVSDKGTANRLTREIVDQAITILSARWSTVEEAAIENSAAMYPEVDLLQGARLAVTWASDASWEIESCGATLRAAMRKLDAEKPESDERSDRRQRRAAALRSVIEGAA